jgi:hypothetical protein
MIVGKGLIATGFESSKEDYSNYIIFASGVSNSKETSDKEYNREKDLIIKTITENKDLKIIYFSSILVENTKNKYFENKLKIEEIIKTNSSNYIIFRIPQIVGNNGNPKNLVNYIKNCILNETEITINTRVERSLLDIEDLVEIVNFCKNKVTCETLKISGIEKIKVFTLCEIISKFVNKDSKLIVDDNIDYDNWSEENSKLIDDAIKNIKSIGYNYNVLKKYIK